MTNLKNDLLQIPVTLTVEIGRKKMPIGEVIKMHSSSVTELNKKTTEPLDIYANGLLIGQGTIVTINGTFGVKITKIIEQNRRIKI